jgi:2-phospho-L-lactate/phosphoenolpyruvate guanylyltransferase
MKTIRSIWAVVPLKQTADAKQRLAGVLDRASRQQLALAMFADVLDAIAVTAELSGILVSTLDETAARIAARYDARVISEAAGEGHTAAVTAAARRLAQEDCAMLTLPADIPLVQADDIRELVHAWAIAEAAPLFCIVPARDERGSNAVLCAPADAVPLRFGEDSFFPHLARAEACGIKPLVLRLPRIALDIDTAADLDLLMANPASTRSHVLLGQWRQKLAAGSHAKGAIVHGAE